MTKTPTQAPRIYLAGPDVFLPNALELAAAKVELCAEAGLTGCFPLDNAIDLKGLPPRAAGLRIAASNEELMNSCDAIIANLTPWHGPSADAGTCYEVGYMRAQGKPCFAYSNDPRSFEQRVEEWVLEHDLGPIRINEQGHRCYANGRVMESFQLSDNLMLEGASRFSGGNYFLGSVPYWAKNYVCDLTAFQQAVSAVARLLTTTKTPELA